MDRRYVAVALVAVVLTSGCLGFLTGSETLEVAAEPVAVSDGAQDDTGYSEARKEPQTVNQTFEVAGESRTVNVTNHVAEYKRSPDLPAFGDQEVARFTVFSTPKVEIAGRTLNPVGELSNRDLALRLQEQYESIQDVALVENRTVTALGEERRVSKFEATATTKGGQETDVILHVANFEHGEDFLVVVAIYPQQLDGEQEHVDRLFEGIEHETGDDG
jgi:hypothetical protein